MLQFLTDRAFWQNIFLAKRRFHHWYFLLAFDLEIISYLFPKLGFNSSLELRYCVFMVTVMLVTSLCWWLYDGDWYQILVAESLCWWFSRCIKSVINILNRSPTSQTCHQNIWSPTSVTNIDVTDAIIDCQPILFVSWAVRESNCQWYTWNQ